MGIVVFLGVAALIYFGMHRYVWARLVRDTGLPRRARIGAVATLGVLGLGLFAAFLLYPRLGGGMWPVSWIAYTWLGVVFYLVVVLGAVDLARAPFALVRFGRAFARRIRARKHAMPNDPAPLPPDEVPSEHVSRRIFVARTIAGVTLASTASITTLGMRNALGDIEVRRVPVRLARLPRALDGYRIGLISDVHIGPLLDRRFLAGVIETLRRLRPDAIAIVGDLVDADVSRIGSDIALLGGLQAPDGTFFVTGNHEYYAGAELWLTFLRRLGIRVLQNERVSIGDPGLGGASFDLAGVPDWHAGRSIPSHTPDLGRALARRDPDRELVLLAHQPSQIVDAARAGVGLQLTGHTHGGQLFPFGALTALAYPYVRGLHRHGEHTQIYVSCGTGFWGPPMRVLAPSEITEITLVAG